LEASEDAREDSAEEDEEKYFQNEQEAKEASLRPLSFLNMSSHYSSKDLKKGSQNMLGATRSAIRGAFGTSVKDANKIREKLVKVFSLYKK